MSAINLVIFKSGNGNNVTVRFFKQETSLERILTIKDIPMTPSYLKYLFVKARKHFEDEGPECLFPEFPKSIFSEKGAVNFSGTSVFIKGSEIYNASFYEFRLKINMSIVTIPLDSITVSFCDENNESKRLVYKFLSNMTKQDLQFLIDNAVERFQEDEIVVPNLFPIFPSEIFGKNNYICPIKPHYFYFAGVDPREAIETSFLKDLQFTEELFDKYNEALTKINVLKRDLFKQRRKTYTKLKYSSCCIEGCVIPENIERLNYPWKNILLSRHENPTSFHKTFAHNCACSLSHRHKKYMGDIKNRIPK